MIDTIFVIKLRLSSSDFIFCMKIIPTTTNTLNIGIRKTLPVKNESEWFSCNIECKLAYIMNATIVSVIIKLDFLLPMKNLKTKNITILKINDKHTGIIISAISISWMLYWKMNNTGNIEKRNGCKGIFFSIAIHQSKNHSDSNW